MDSGLEQANHWPYGQRGTLVTSERVENLQHEYKEVVCSLENPWLWKTQTLVNLATAC
jgi:hypothetical protein